MRTVLGEEIPYGPVVLGYWGFIVVWLVTSVAFGLLPFLVHLVIWVEQGGNESTYPMVLVIDVIFFSIVVGVTAIAELVRQLLWSHVHRKGAQNVLLLLLLAALIIVSIASAVMLGCERMKQAYPAANGPSLASQQRVLAMALILAGCSVLAAATTQHEIARSLTKGHRK